MIAVMFLTFLCLAVQARACAARAAPPTPSLSPRAARAQAVGFLGGFTMFDTGLALLRERPPPTRCRTAAHPAQWPRARAQTAAPT